MPQHRSPLPRHIRNFTAVVTLLLAPALNACRDTAPDIPPVPPHHIDTTAATAPVDSMIPPADSLPHAVTGAPSNQLTAQARTEAVRQTGQFITVIDSNNQQAFWNMLSQRSRLMVDRDKLASKDDIWKGARETLGDINDRRISIIGGTRDSAALLVEGLRLIDSERVSDPVIINLLREDGHWRVMYPGLLYPGHHLRK